MAFKLKKGAQVRQVLPAPIEGEITDFELDRETGEVIAKVAWVEGEHTHSRFFRESELEEVGEKPEAEM